ncbi:tetrahydrofolate dehydrogenase/cyclohydrolase catalytic domain-containing protein [Kribbella sp. NPDC051620]|uniref:tetrahydrofolate dehydrogenase/cyclohydrolase catalytic domain-containing protein n=1 Tax=Kribbella sp. NPDC051620 TaxID=3364120 RepID=UPI003793B969
MEASRVSAVQKEKAFSQLGYRVDHQVLSGRTSAADFAALIDRHSADPSTSAVIVQYPPPQHLAPLVQRLAPDKDIDGLLGDRSLQQACATADGITRVVRPFTQDNPRIAVVGGQGLVGSGVVRLLQQEGLRVESLDAGDDLRRTRDADIVVSATGNPHVPTGEHIRPHHRLVVDSGFMPQPDGSMYWRWLFCLALVT